MKFKPSYKQLTIDVFKSSLDGLEKRNRWVWLGDHLPWDVYGERYGLKFNNQESGAGAKPARMVIAAMLIKHISEGGLQVPREDEEGRQAGEGWDAYHEGSDMQLHIDKYKERFGCLPAPILADKIYMNKDNRAILKDLEIKSYSKPLGRPPKDPPSPERQAAMDRAVGKRNEIECPFGTGKRVYQANDIRAKLPETAECWTGMCYFAKSGSFVMTLSNY